MVFQTTSKIIKNTLSLLIIVIVFISAWKASAQTVININDRGWYNNAGSHNPGNNNTYTGVLNTRTYRSYYRFTIPAGVTCLDAATLELEIENHYGNAGHTMTVYDITPANVPILDTNNGSGNGLGIFADLGSGTIYGTQGGLTSASVGTIVSFTLPAAALTDIISASGSDFAASVRVTPGGGGGLRALRFSGGNEARVHRLTYTECPLMPIIDANKTVNIHDPLSQGLYAVPGNDTIYSISVTNSGTGSADIDSMVIIDQIPNATIFYNGDIDDAGPQTNPVSFSESGSGLTFTYASDAAYSNAAVKPANFAACTYSPSAGYDPNVTYICINPKGGMAAGSPSPNFIVNFRVRIE